MEIVKLIITAEMRGGRWCLIGSENQAVAGLKDDFVDKVESGCAIGSKILNRWFDEWHPCMCRCTSRLKYEWQSAGRMEERTEKWHRKLGVMSQSIAGRETGRKKGCGRPVTRLKQQTWQQRLGCIGVTLAYERRPKKRKDQKDAWSRWCESHSSNMRKREYNAAHRKGNKQEA